MCSRSSRDSSRQGRPRGRAHNAPPASCCLQWQSVRGARCRRCATARQERLAWASSAQSATALARAAHSVIRWGCWRWVASAHRETSARVSSCARTSCMDWITSAVVSGGGAVSGVAGRDWFFFDPDDDEAKLKVDEFFANELNTVLPAL